jgi:VIT1/CCC1 family predicted Fe2+/Mn2+ transporter
MKDPIKESLDKIRLLESHQVDEYSWRQGADDAHAALRGITHGLSLGFDDNILAGIDSLTGNEPDYKTALRKQMANTADIKSKASSAEFDNPFHNTWIGNKFGAENPISSFKSN